MGTSSTYGAGKRSINMPNGMVHEGSIPLPFAVPALVVGKTLLNPLPTQEVEMADETQTVDTVETEAPEVEAQETQENTGTTLTDV